MSAQKWMSGEQRAAGQLGAHAVVIGGSLAGLVAARVLADHFAQVTIVERDRLPDAPAFRKGVPQGRHAHVLLRRGGLILEQLLPGLEAELLAAGALEGQFPTDLLWLMPAGWCQRFADGVRSMGCSRELLEWHVRQRVAALPAVEFVAEQDVTGLVPGADGQGVAGVALRARGGDAPAHATSVLAADLVVDASGRDSRAPRWLEALGYDAPPETRIDGHLAYCSRVFAPPPGFQADWRAIYIQTSPPTHRHGGLLQLIEGDRWLVTLAQRGGEPLPRTDAEFLAFARGLRTPVLYDAIKDAEPLTPIHGYARTENHLRHYERLARWPERFVLLGDAVCAFNPIYGQGMTTAAEGALLLDRGLRERRASGDLSGLARRFQRQLARQNGAAWLMATSEDLRDPATEGARATPLLRLQHAYFDRVLQVATVHPVVNRALVEVLQLVTPPAALFHPRVLLPVLRGAAAPGAAHPPSQAEAARGVTALALAGRGN